MLAHWGLVDIQSKISQFGTQTTYFFTWNVPFISPAMMLAHWELVDNTGRTQNFKIESPSLFGRGANHYKPTIFHSSKDVPLSFFH